VVGLGIAQLVDVAVHHLQNTLTNILKVKAVPPTSAPLPARCDTVARF
jgi:hypothetical protein